MKLIILTIVSILVVLTSTERVIRPMVDRFLMNPNKYPQWTQQYPKYPKQTAVSPLIVGGDVAEPCQYPFMAALIIQSGQSTFFCGGSLISPSYVLTAAHCLEGVDKVEVILGAHDFTKMEATQQRITVSKENLKIHENYDSQNIINDIAVIKFNSPVTLNDCIQPISLPHISEIENTFAGENGNVTGWGRYSILNSGTSDKLRQVTTKIITNDECKRSFDNIQDSHLCASGAGGKSSCNGDSGGPISVKKELVSFIIGIVSFGNLISSVLLGCQGGFPHAYTRVTEFKTWIETHSDARFPNN